VAHGSNIGGNPVELFLPPGNYIISGKVVARSFDGATCTCSLTDDTRNVILDSSIASVPSASSVVNQFTNLSLMASDIILSNGGSVGIHCSVQAGDTPAVFENGVLTATQVSGVFDTPASP
jgi:hypothetical protein